MWLDKWAGGVDKVIRGTSPVVQGSTGMIVVDVARVMHWVDST